MKSTERILLNMLANEIFDAGVDVPAYEHWHDVIALASKHGVVPLLFKEMTNAGFVPDDVLHTLRSSVVTAAYQGEQLLNIQDEILNVLRSNNIPCAVYKGASVAACYPHPELRPHGDIDILVRQSDIQRSADLLEESGCVLCDAGHDFHTSFLKKGVHVELHRAVSWFPKNSVGRYCIELFSHALDQTSRSTMQEWSFPVLLPKYQLLSLLFHMERHMTTSGFGLRQLCDWAVCVDQYRDIIDSDMLDDFECCGVLQFAKVLSQVCTQFLGMPQLEWSRNVSKRSVSSMMKEILDGGMSSFSSPERSFSSMFISPSQTGLKRKTLIGSLIAQLNITAKTRYPDVIRFPFLLPVFWIYIPSKTIVRLLKSRYGGKSVFLILSTARKRRKLYRDLKLFDKQ